MFRSHELMVLPIPCSSNGQIWQITLQIRRLSIQHSTCLDANDAVSLLPVREGRAIFMNPYVTHSATEFSRSQTGRDADFSTNSTERGTFLLNERYSNPATVQEYDDSPEPRGIHSSGKRQRKVKGRLIIQFAANDPVHLADAAELARPFVDAIDLNCGS